MIRNYEWHKSDIISINWPLIQKQMMKKEGEEGEGEERKATVRENRQKMRLNIKNNHLRNPQSAELLSGVKQEKTRESTGNKRRRRASEDIQNFDFLSVFKDKIVNEGFQKYFQLGDKLGEGTQSIVYRCVEKISSKTYAVKICKKKDPELFQNMRINYQILKELDHEMIVKGKFLYLNEKKLTCHIVIEEFNHPELREIMKSRNYKPFPDEQTAQIVYDILECLDYLSEKGVCHRDIKPENILYHEETGEIKLIDFELSRMQRYQHEKLELWSNCGTIPYRAPESFRGGYGIPVDIWAAGVTAFELMTGKLPFRSSFSSELVKKICQKQPNYEKYNLTPLAIKFLSRLLEKSPQKRITPKEALSDPYLLKHLNMSKLYNHRSLSLKLHHIHSQNGLQRTAEMEQEEEEKGNSDKIVKYYDENDKFSFKGTLDKDIGVRRFEDSKSIFESEEKA